MDPEVAELVRAAEQAELLGAPHPLGGGNRVTSTRRGAAVSEALAFPRRPTAPEPSSIEVDQVSGVVPGPDRLEGPGCPTCAGWCSARARRPIG